MTDFVQYKHPGELDHLELDPRPTWVFDMEQDRVWWANSAALAFWKAEDMECLLARDFTSNSEVVNTRLNNLARHHIPGQLIRESWTLYPLGNPIHVLADHDFVRIEEGRLSLLYQVVQYLDEPEDPQDMRLREAMRYTSVMVSMFDTEGQLLTENPAAASFNRSHGNTRTLANHLTEPKKISEIIELVLNGEAFTEERTVKTQGEPRVLQSTATQGRDPVTGNPAIFLSEEDITLRVRQSEERYQTIFHSAADAIWITDPTKRGFIAMNAKAEDLFGIRIEQFNNDEFNLFDFSPVYQANGQKSIELGRVYANKALAGESPTFEWIFLNNEGNWIPCKLTLTRFPDPKRDLVRTSAIDLSAAKIAERQRLDLEVQLIQAQKLESLGQLTGGVAHDFNNLLAIIMGNMELLNEIATESEEKSLIKSTLKATERGARITGSMLAFARKSDLNPTRLDLTQTLLDLNNWMTGVIPDNIQVETRCDEKLDLIRADLAGVERTLLNLIINARDAMLGGGKVIIEARNTTSIDSAGVNINCVVLSVRDTGIGIDAATCERVFEPFFSTKPQHNNSGLGLSMVHGFMEQSGGSVRFTSDVGEGTLVELTFPSSAFPSNRLIESHLTQDSASSAGSGSTSQSLSILLVEDQEAVLEVLKKLLEGDGHRVTSATSGDEAAEMYSDKLDQFDLLITDIDMPGTLQGPDLAQQMKSLKNNLPVILLSGHIPESANNSDLNNQKIHLQKPISRKKLTAAIASLSS